MISLAEARARWAPASLFIVAAVLLALAGSEGLAAGDAAPAVKSVAPGLLTSDDIGNRMRVFAAPGDFKLQNGDVTAVVRKRDGWLTDFWRNRAILPTIDQLDTMTEIDSIWQVHPVATMGELQFPFLARRVTGLADGIEVESVASVYGLKYRAVTVHRLHPTQPRLRMTTTISVEGGGKPGPLAFGDLIKWDNTTYYVDDVPTPRMSYKGIARWIGRKGSGGDLVYRAAEPEKMYVDYNAKMRGFQGAITALFRRRGLQQGKSATFSRELVFEPLPVPERREPKDTGTLVVRVSDESGRLLPAKIKIKPYGRDETLFPDDGGLDGTDRFMWTGNGTFQRELKPARYELLVTSGFEREAGRKSVQIRAGKAAEVDVKLPRALATPGWIAADLHLHQAPSVDSDISLAARVIAVAAEGVEFAVATDHYVVTDLGPTTRWLRDKGLLSADLITMSGSEVSTLGNRFGHFNVFPLLPGSNVKYDMTTPSELFADARRQSPDGVVQVNHPRLGGPTLGYFTAFGLDSSGEPSVAGYDGNFDTLEVYNGDEAYNLKLVKRVFADWVHLLGRGRRYAATGSSDSHNLAFLDPGLPRTLIQWGNAANDADDLRAPTKDVLRALKAGHSIVTSGPIIEANVGDAGPGETARGLGKVARVRVKIRAAPWIDVRSLEIVEGGQGRRAHWTEIRRTKNVVRLERTFDVPIEDKTFIIVTVQGEREIPNAGRKGTVPFAFTNPIWVEP